MRQPRRTNSWCENNAEKATTNNTLLNSAPHSPSSASTGGFTPLSQSTPPGTSEDLQSLVKDGIVRQSPPPIADARALPPGALISPPESLNNSSDEAEEGARGRKLDRHMKDLHEAVSVIPQRPSISPPQENPDALRVTVPNGSALSSEGMHYSFSTGSLSGLVAGSRKISHAKSNTEPHIVLPISLGPSLTGSEEDTDEDRPKPAMVRKKSGELVRPALRASSRKRPLSMPGTPTFSKSVHFDSRLEDIRHFCDIDRPSAVSAGSSPVDTYDTDDEFPFEKRSPPFEWELSLGNFPTQTQFRQSRSVRMERVWLSTDQKSLMGSVVVANLAFQKSVVCRFTLDYWKTTSEVAADWTQEVHPREGPIGHDRFTFSIKLSDTTNLENKTLFFCIRYSVNGSDYWDNNNNSNFQVVFRKKMLPRNGKRGFSGVSSRPALGLPRSSRRSASGSNRKTSSSNMDDFHAGNKPNKQSIRDMIGDAEPLSGVRLKGVKSTSNLGSDNLASGVASPSGQAFSNRYDFGASLSAAKQAAKGPSKREAESEVLYMKPNRRGEAASTAKARQVSTNNTTMAERKAFTNSYAPTGSVIASSSYEEILNKYCFVCTAK